jgi:hypothetical protein
MGNYILDLLGRKGNDIIADTNTHSGPYTALVIIEDAVFTTLTGGELTVYGTLGDITWPAGILIGGGFTSVKLASGVVLAYRVVA